jgi:hypothetical protein
MREENYSILITKVLRSLFRNMSVVILAATVVGRPFRYQAAVQVGALVLSGPQPVAAYEWLIMPLALCDVFGAPLARFDLTPHGLSLGALTAHGVSEAQSLVWLQQLRAEPGVEALCAVGAVDLRAIRALGLGGLPDVTLQDELEAHGRPLPKGRPPTALAAAGWACSHALAAIRA